MAADRERELEEEVSRLRAEVDRLQGELSALRERALARTRRANAARSKSAAKRDDMVVKAIVAYIRLKYHIRTRKLDTLGYPYFARWGDIRTTMAEHLNARGVPAPLGGLWSPKQISRALERHAARRLEAAEEEPARRKSGPAV